MIKCDNLSVKFKDKIAVDNFSYVFEEGKIHCVIGPNGCGKTTLIKEIVRANARKGDVSIAYVPQETHGEMAMNVADVVALGRYDKSKFWSGLRKSDYEAIENAMELTETKELALRLYDTLSGGEKQRVMAARAIAQDADWTILDEPNSNFDVRHTRILMDTARKLRDTKGKSFIFVLHDINTASRYSDNVLIMKDGKLISDGAPSKCLNSENLQKAYDTPFGSSTGEFSSEKIEIFYPL